MELLRISTIRACPNTTCRSSFIQLESFPLTASGKVLKRRLVEMVAEGLLKPQPVRWQG